MKSEVFIMNQSEEYVTLDLKTLVFDILRHWKNIILAGISLAVLMGGTLSFIGYNDNYELDAEEYAKEVQEYQENVAIYEKGYFKFQEKRDYLQDYLLNNDLMAADPNHVYIVNASYYIDNGVQSVEETDTLVRNYRNLLQQQSVFEQISQMTNVRATDLKTLIAVDIINTESFSIRVIHFDKEVSTKIMQYLQDFVQDAYKKLDSTVETHTLKLMNNSGGFGPSDELANLQTSYPYSLIACEDDLEAVEKTLSDLQRSAPAEQKIVTNSFAKWFILGGVGGAMLAAAYYLFASLFSGKVNSIEQMADSYSTTVLGEILLENVKRSKTDRFLDKLEGRAGENTEENFRYIAENIRNHCTGEERILVCCDESSQSCDFVESVKKYLPEIQWTSAENLLKNPDALQQFGKCDAVLRLVTKNGTSSKAIAKEWKMLREFNKKLLGFVFFY